MKLIFTEQKNFTEQQVQDLFLSVGWVSGQYPSRLHKALLHSPTVITVWDHNKDVPDDFECPVCFVGKGEFSEE